MHKLPQNTLPQGSRLGEDVDFEGCVSFTNLLTVFGKLKGDVQSDLGRLEVEETASIDAKVVVHTLQTKGSVCGDVVCHDACLFQNGSAVKGIVISPIVEMSSQVDFDGEISMLTQSEEYKLMEMTPQEAHEQIRHRALSIDDSEVRQRYGLKPTEALSSSKAKGKKRFFGKKKQRRQK